MPTPRLRADNPHVHEALSIWDSLQNPRVSDVADALGWEWKKADRHIKCGLEARERDPAISAGMDAVGTGITPAGMWIKTGKDEDGISRSIYLKPTQEAVESVLERAVAVFSDLPKAPAIPSPKHTAADLLTLYPLFDVHLGMHAWGDETGGDNYDLKLSVSDIHMAVGNVMALSPDSAEAILLIGGDFFHGDDNTNQTPRNHHPLDVDGRHFKVLDTGIEVVAGTIERLASKHKRVTVRVLRGNHDEHSHMVLTLALAQRYRGHERITVDKSPRDIFMHQWGKCLIAAHHGDKAKPERLAMILAEICPFWSESPHRIVFTGHRHHQQSNDFPGIEWEQFRAFCPPDAYGAQFAPRRALHAITFNKASGIATRAKDPIRRAA
jgi:hypothetical protein